MVQKVGQIVSQDFGSTDVSNAYIFPIEKAYTLMKLSGTEDKNRTKYADNIELR